MARGKGTTKRRAKVEANGKPEPTPTALPPVNFGFRFMRLKDWCKYATWGDGKITRVKLEWGTRFDLETDQWMVRVFRESKYCPKEGNVFRIPSNLGLFHVPFTHRPLMKGWWIGERNQAVQLHRLATEFMNSYSDVTHAWYPPSVWHYVSDSEDDEETMNTVLAELLAEGKISAGDERVVLIDESEAVTS